MDPDFWHQRWINNQIAFHEGEANPLLVKHFNALSLGKGARVFVPLCGKTLDIAWLLSEGYRVVGAELVELAVEQLFAELGVTPEISQVGKTKLYRTDGLDIFSGNIFDVSADSLGQIDAVYDRAALVALPEEMRAQYAAHLMAITDKAPQLLVTFEYDQSVMPGPPFSVSNEEVTRHYGEDYNLSVIASMDVPGGLKGQCAAIENVWLLRAL